jgi:hypothetical protein
LAKGHLRTIESVHLPDTDLVDVNAELVTTGRDDQRVEAPTGRLGVGPDVTAVRWRTLEPDGEGLNGGTRHE